MNLIYIIIKRLFHYQKGKCFTRHAKSNYLPCIHLLLPYIVNFADFGFVL